MSNERKKIMRDAYTDDLCVEVGEIWSLCGVEGFEELGRDRPLYVVHVTLDESGDLYCHPWRFDFEHEARDFAKVIRKAGNIDPANWFFVREGRYLADTHGN